MAFIKEESEDMKIEEVFTVKQEDTEEQTDLMTLKEESEVLNEMKDHDLDSTLEPCTAKNSSPNPALARGVQALPGPSPNPTRPETKISITLCSL
ncbi:unnamed protein product [Leuciscus chuanchicus]